MKRFIKQFRYGEKGFTLIELLVVVAILGVLAAVAIPNVGKFIGKGKAEAASTEHHNVQTAVMAAMADASSGNVSAGNPVDNNIAINFGDLDQNPATSDACRSSHYNSNIIIKGALALLIAIVLTRLGKAKLLKWLNIAMLFVVLSNGICFSGYLGSWLYWQTQIATYP